MEFYHSSLTMTPARTDSLSAGIRGFRHYPQAGWRAVPGRIPRGWNVWTAPIAARSSTDARFPIIRREFCHTHDRSPNFVVIIYH